MPKRTMVFASAVVMIVVAAMAASVRPSFAQAAADDCLAKPNAAAPKGQHWYYRTDRPGNRRCWYLGPEGAKPRQALSPKPQPAASAAPRPESPPPPITSAATDSPATVPPFRTVAAAVAAEPVDRETATAFMQPAPLSTSMRPFDTNAAPASDGIVAEPAAIAATGDAPPPSPAVTEAQLPAAAARPASGFAPWHLLTLVAVALALAMVIRKLMREIAARRLLRQRMALREQWQSQAPPPWRPKPADRAQAGGVQQPRHTTVPAPRPAVPRSPAPQREPQQAAETKDVEASLHRLLQDWQRVAA